MSNKKAIVIGSGFGGMAAAIRLQVSGIDTTIIEKREKIGGRAYQLKKKGYTFDMGPSLITTVEIIDELFGLAGKKPSDYMDLVSLDPFYRIYFHDKTYIDYNGDSENMKRQLAQFNEKDAQNYDRYIASTKPIYEAVIVDKLGGKAFDNLKIFLGFIPKVIKLGAWKTVYQYAKSYFKDFRSRFLFSFHPLFLGGNPFRSPSVYMMIPYLEKQQGVWYSKGGMYSFIEALKTLFEELGGTIKTGEGVEKLEVSSGKITQVVTEKSTYTPDLVVSNADIAHTYIDMVASKHRKKWTDKKLKKADYTMSLFLLYLGTKKQYPQLKHHTLILTKRYESLLKDIFDNKVLPEDYSMYLHAPTRTDASMAPEGCESMYVLIPVHNLQGKTDWSSKAEEFKNKVLAELEAWGLEDLRENLEVCEMMTPVDFKDKLNSIYGNAFGLEPKLSQTAYFRPHNKSEDVSNLYLVGAGTHPGAGVPGVLLSAEAAEGCWRKDLGMKARE